MLRRSLPSLVCSAVLLLGAAPARADVALPNHRTVPSEAVITGLRDFPAYRFVIAVHTHRPDPEMFKSRPLPQPVAVREGEPAPTDTVYFQELRAIPADTPDPVTDEWVLASRAPTSGSFTLRPLRVPNTSGERVSRARFHVRQIQAGWISLELLSSVAVMADGSERPLSKVIPTTFAIESFEAPPDWQLFLMPDPSWPRAEPPLPAIPCKPGELLPLSPGPRTLVAVRGSVGSDGSLDGKTHLVWGQPLDAWRRREVPADSAAAARRVELEVRVEPDGDLGISHGGHFEDAHGRAFHDEDLTMPVDVYFGWQWWAAGGGACVALLVAGTWAWRRRRRRAAARAPAPRALD
jgi:hypothetical protein